MALTCPPTTAARTGLLSLKFNQDQSCLTMATATGFRVWNADPFTLRYERDLGGGIGLATVLFRSNIVALVGGGPNPRFRNDRVMLWDDCRNQSIAELCFNSTVRGVEMVRDAIAIALDERVYIYTLANLDLVKRVPTVDNPRGLVDIRASEGGTDNVIATLSTKAGYIEVHHSDNRRPLVLRAHEMPLARLSLNADGSLLATASEKGTVIRVWDTASGEKRAELRRGKDAASINNLVFSLDSRWLAVSSDRGTVHIFDLDTPPTEAPSGLLQYIGSTGVLGAGVSEYSTGWFSKAKIHLPDSAPTCVCAFGRTPGQVFVVDAEGIYGVYDFDVDKGGEARVVDRFLFGNEDREQA
ncbi:WD40-repeat containing protein [Pandoravirus quercus]|uniref:WD40-repeat containing protein n=1 Tax=Pandoravirus quercus TaxID=2107709 RepID=A0A2U7UA70_9VIRU|nr:WD40-repeat containing protein [Pandoravirus quercus]AVK75341.1 WD40-repeat containing protein [Pandoravirus quercus]